MKVWSSGKYKSVGEGGSSFDGKDSGILIDRAGLFDSVSSAGAAKITPKSTNSTAMIIVDFIAQKRLNSKVN